MKRFAFHDPYNPVRISELVIKALVPVALFWLLVGAILAACIGNAKTRPALIVFLGGGGAAVLVRNRSARTAALSAFFPCFHSFYC